MKRLYPALALVLPGFVLPVSADPVPKLDVARSCREAQAFGGEANKLAYKGCMQDENDALAQLQRNWSRYKPENRSNCIAQGISPMPSYVEILTCIEMYDDASAFNRPDGGGRPLSGAIPPVTPAPAVPGQTK